MSDSLQRFLGELADDAEGMLAKNDKESCCVAVPRRWLEQVIEDVRAVECGEGHEDD